VSFESGSSVHIVGVGGAGMSGLARLLAEKGCEVSGSDAVDSALLRELEDSGVTTYVGHSSSQGVKSETVVWSPAIGSDNVELLEASRRGARLLRRSEVLFELGSQQRVLGLTGTHGKTTATSMLVQVMRAAGRDDSRLLGAAVTGVGPNGHYGHDDLILEVDESYGTFSLLHPFALGVLNVEADHLDHYGDVHALERAFSELIDRTSGPVVVWSSDAGASRVALSATRDVVTVGAGDSMWRVENVSLERRRSTFELKGPSRDVRFELAVTGLHNVANAAVVAILAMELGVDVEAIGRGLAAFMGAPRRFQYLGAWSGVDVYEDYAHLPGEIEATLRATRAAGYERIAAVFQPHRVTRTVALATAFASAFDSAMSVIVTDIYSAGEPNPTNVTGEVVAKALRARRDDIDVRYVPELVDVVREVERLHDDIDVVLLLGAGDIASIAPHLSASLHE
jgi:UDP-N-acetylmuramate--alanine ligase